MKNRQTTNVVYKRVAVAVRVKENPIWEKRWNNLLEIMGTLDDIVITCCGDNQCSEVCVWTKSDGNLVRDWEWCDSCQSDWCSDHWCGCKE